LSLWANSMERKGDILLFFSRSSRVRTKMSRMALPQGVFRVGKAHSRRRNAPPSFASDLKDAPFQNVPFCLSSIANAVACRACHRQKAENAGSGSQTRFIAFGVPVRGQRPRSSGRASPPSIPGPDEPSFWWFRFCRSQNARQANEMLRLCSAGVTEPWRPVLLSQGWRSRGRQCSSR
jgi:hypothetical protein